MAKPGAAYDHIVVNVPPRGPWKTMKDEWLI